MGLTTSYCMRYCISSIFAAWKDSWSSFEIFFKGFYVLHGGEVDIFRCYGTEVTGSRVDCNVIVVDGSVKCSGDGKENTVGKLNVDCGSLWRCV